MREHLLFTLYGPMQAWGTSAAVGEERTSAGFPTRSGVLGLLAGALGIRRHEEERLAALSGGYGVAVASHAPGLRFADYQTTQVGGDARKRVYRTRRDEVGGLLPHGEEANTILSTREYLANACFTACLWAQDAATALHPLEDLRKALLQPVFVPSLGRKACPVARPFTPTLVLAPNAGQALLAYRPVPEGEAEPITRLPGWSSTPTLVRADAGHGWPHTLMTTQVRDAVTHHGRRQFSLRDEEHFTLPAGGAA